MTVWVAGNVLLACVGFWAVLTELSRHHRRHWRLLVGTMVLVLGFLGATGQLFRWVLSE